MGVYPFILFFNISNLKWLLLFVTIKYKPGSSWQRTWWSDNTLSLIWTNIPKGTSTQAPLIPRQRRVCGGADSPGGSFCRRSGASAPCSTRVWTDGCGCRLHGTPSCPQTAGEKTGSTFKLAYLWSIQVRRHSASPPMRLAALHAALCQTQITNQRWLRLNARDLQLITAAQTGKKASLSILFVLFF